MASISHILLLAASVTPALSFCGGHTHLDKRAEGGIPISEFGYTGLVGPLLWTQLDAENSVCATGTSQSPINMVPEVFTLRPASDMVLTIPDAAEGAVFENLGSTVEVVMEGLGGSMVVDDKEFEFAQFHFHHPSEHVDNGVSLPMEMHMVFQTAEEETAVIGVYVDLVDEGHVLSSILSPQAVAPTTMLETIFASVGEIAEPGTETHTQPLVMSELTEILAAGEFQAYSGSLTTPPCSEGVSWFVSTQKLALSRATYQTVRDVVGFNSRFPQNTPGEENLLAMAVAAAPAEEAVAGNASEAANATAPAVRRRRFANRLY